MMVFWSGSTELSFRWALPKQMPGKVRTPWLLLPSTPDRLSHHTQNRLKPLGSNRETLKAMLEAEAVLVVAVSQCKRVPGRFPAFPKGQKRIRRVGLTL